MSDRTAVFALEGVELPPNTGETLTPLLGVLLPAATGKQYIVVGNLPWPDESFSLLQDADPAAQPGDVLEVDLVTIEGEFSITVFEDGTFVLDDDDDGTEQTFQYRLWRAATATWTSLATVTVEASVSEMEVSGASSGSESSAVEVQQEHGLAVSGASSGSDAAPVELTQTHTLETAGSSSGSEAPGVELVNEDELAVSAASSGSESSPVELAQIHTLEVEPASSGSDAPAIELFGDGNLAVADCSSGSSADPVEVSGPVAVGGGGGKPRRQKSVRTAPYERKGLEQLRDSARRARLIAIAKQEDEHLIEAMKKLLMEAA